MAGLPAVRAAGSHPIEGRSAVEVHLQFGAVAIALDHCFCDTRQRYERHASAKQMSEPTQPATTNLGPSVRRPKRVLWKWSLALTAAVLVYMTWQCDSALNLGSESADQAVQRFHDHLNRGEFDEICREGDEAFSHGEKHDELLHFLEQVHNKLGNAGSATRVNLHANLGTGGTFVTAQYATHFEQAPGGETFTWRKGWDTLKLYGYDVRSDAFLK